MGEGEKFGPGEQQNGFVGNFTVPLRFFTENPQNSCLIFDKSVVK